MREREGPPAAVGMAIGDVDTPALLVDLDALEYNLTRMAGAAAAAGVRLRPHAKTHKCAEIALRQMALGASGICCQKVSEAEAMVGGGVRDVLVSNEIVDRRKLSRLAALATSATVRVCADSVDAVDARFNAAAAAESVEIGVLVEIDRGRGPVRRRSGRACVAARGAYRVVVASPVWRIAGVSGACAAYPGGGRAGGGGGVRRRVRWHGRGIS